MNANSYAHKYLRPLLRSDMIALDLTCGNGLDTLFLCQNTKKVYAFDIQEEAIERSKKRLEGFDNVIFIKDDHARVDEYVKEKIDITIMNLGFLPYGDKTIITKPASSLLAFKKAYALLKEGGYLSLTLYLGHKGGLYEYQAFKRELNSYFVLEHYQNKRGLLEPQLFIIKKVGRPQTRYRQISERE